VLKKILIFAVALMLAWVGLRCAFAVRTGDPAYKFTAGTNYVSQEWNYCSRYADETDPRKMTAVAKGWNRLNDTCFRLSYPLFGLENRLLGGTMKKGDADYDAYMGQVGKITAVAWDYAISDRRDGRGMKVVKGQRVVQQVE
jgi:hypothetical protein